MKKDTGSRFGDHEFEGKCLNDIVGGAVKQEWVL